MISFSPIRENDFYAKNKEPMKGSVKYQASAICFFGRPLDLFSAIICGIRSSSLSKNESRLSVNSRIGLEVELPILKFSEKVLPSPSIFDMVITSAIEEEYQAKN